ncbi:uncharacterized protein ColSpa_01390 [Colletotrichum spaethianum]|uniref:Uncharacterized protein n=1 Tax=Colletotrichum spaethianum TaxID=700344 RepID=A0AA37P6Z3_9PEZI|nr:uncharacterized protein ColSpa_01390 [Colletotrichum spaethianum]GKT41209.1 hypothetical protein ColSpa_01390 [Colletotrichum spaethianum]
MSDAAMSAAAVSDAAEAAASRAHLAAMGFPFPGESVLNEPLPDTLAALANVLVIPTMAAMSESEYQETQDRK